MIPRGGMGVQSVANAVEIVLAMFLMAGTGILLYRIGWLDDKNLPLISRLVVMVGLPATIVNTMFTQYTRDELIANAPGILAVLLCVIAMAALGLGLAKLMKLERRRIGSFVAMFSFANSVFIGLPVSKALFGDVAAPLALTYYFSNTSMFWAIGHTLMRRFGDGEAELPKKRSLWSAIPLPLATLVACGLLLLVRFKPPKFFMSACGYVGSIVTPLSLIYTGAIIMRMIRNGHVRWQKGYLAVCLGRFVICPALLLLASAPFGLPDLMQRVLFMQATMPVMSQTVIVAGTTGSDNEYAAGGMALTTALSLLFIPLYMYLMETLF